MLRLLRLWQIIGGCTGSGLHLQYLVSKLVLTLNFNLKLVEIKLITNLTSNYLI